MKDALIVAMSTLERVIPKLIDTLAPGQWKICKAWLLEKLNSDEWEKSVAAKNAAKAVTTAATPSAAKTTAGEARAN